MEIVLTNRTESIAELDELILQVTLTTQWMTVVTIRKRITNVSEECRDADGDVVDRFDTDMVLFRCGALVAQGKLVYEFIEHYSDELKIIFRRAF